MDKILIKDLNKVIKNNKILNNINLQLDKNKTYGFVGKNGAGKTVLFKILCGLLKPTSGRIVIFGEELHKDISFPKSISVILEKPGFLDHYTGFDNLWYLASIKKKINKEDVKNALKKVGLDPHDKKKVKAYSLGMKQRLALAQSIMEKPDLILLDEPMNGLDKDAREMAYNLINEEKERGATILMTSHYQEDIESLCDKTYLLEYGKLVNNFQ